MCDCYYRIKSESDFRVENSVENGYWMAGLKENQCCSEHEDQSILIAGQNLPGWNSDRLENVFIQARTAEKVRLC